MKKYFQLIAVLLIISGLSGLILGVVNELTKDQVAYVEDQKVVNGIKDNIYEGAAEKVEYEFSDSKNIINNLFQVLDKDGEILGYVFLINAPESYSGDLNMLVGINLDGTVSGTAYTTVLETPGLGSRVKDKEFNAYFEGIVGIIKERRNMFVTKDGDTLIAVDALSGSTISKNSVIKGIDYCLQYFNENIKE